MRPFKACSHAICCQFTARISFMLQETDALRPSARHMFAQLLPHHLNQPAHCTHQGCSQAYQLVVVLLHQCQGTLAITPAQACVCCRISCSCPVRQKVSAECCTSRRCAASQHMHMLGLVLHNAAPDQSANRLRHTLAHVEINTGHLLVQCCTTQPASPATSLGGSISTSTRSPSLKESQ